MHKFYTLFLSLLLFSVFSCKNDDFTLGTGWVNPKFSVIKIDTFTVELATILEDSISTSAQNVFLIGQYDDKGHTGKTVATSYFSLINPETIELNEDEFFDSLVIEFKTSGTYMGDTLVPQTVYLHRLVDRLEYQDGNKAYYNTTFFELEDTPMGSSTFIPDPVINSFYDDGFNGYKTEPIQIKVSENFGKELFEKIRNKDEDLSTKEYFLDYIKGFALVTDTNSLTNSIVGIKADTSFSMRLYYHEKGNYIVEKEMRFKFDETNNFSNIKANRSNTSLVGFDDNKELSSYKTNNMAYLQSGADMHVKLTFPTIGEITRLGTYGYIEKAILRLKPVKGTYFDKTPLPKQLNIYATKGPMDANEIISNENGLAQTGNLIIDGMFNEKTVYSFDITNFLNSQLRVVESSRGYLILRYPLSQAPKNVERAIFGNHMFSGVSAASINRVEVEIFYTVYDEKK